jgi:WD40 repeat protein
VSSSEWEQIGDEIHVWHAALDREGQVPGELESTLSLEEKARADRFHFANDRNRFVVARGLATLPASTNLPAYNNSEWSSDGTFLAVKRDYDPGGTRADWEVWDAAAARRVMVLQNVHKTAVSFRPHSHQLIAARERELSVWDLKNGTAKGRFPLRALPNLLVYSPGGERFAAVHDWEGGWLVSVHESTNGVLLASQFFSRQVHRISWHPSGRWLAAPDAGGNVHMMDAESGQTRLLGQHKVDAVQTWFSPDGAYVMSGGWDKEIICWDAEARRRAITISLDSLKRNVFKQMTGGLWQSAFVAALFALHPLHVS